MSKNLLFLATLIATLSAPAALANVVVGPPLGSPGCVITSMDAQKLALSGNQYAHVEYQCDAESLQQMTVSIWLDPCSNPQPDVMSTIVQSGSGSYAKVTERYPVTQRQCYFSGPIYTCDMVEVVPIPYDSTLDTSSSSTANFRAVASITWITNSGQQGSVAARDAVGCWDEY